ncbi:MAG: transposase [Legionellales bacterium]|nr:transposase [Legionellales bacterium]
MRYDGNNVIFKYLDHKTKFFRHFKLTTEDFIAKFISHIHDFNFRTIKYYGFLSNRLISDLLPKVKDIIGQHDDKQLALHGFQKLMIDEFNVDPLKCLFCGCQLVLNIIRFGITSAKKFLSFHPELALLKNI